MNAVMMMFVLRHVIPTILVSLSDLCTKMHWTVSRIILFSSCIFATIELVDCWTTQFLTSAKPIRRCSRILYLSSTDPSIVSESEYNDADNNDDDQDDFWGLDELELLEGAGVDFEDDDSNDDWTPDAIKAQQKRKSKTLRPAKEVIKDPSTADQKPEGDPIGNRPSPYTEEEEELIEALGGKYAASGRRDDGFLGDSTLSEIASDYSVPICYLADVLCMWGVPVPINVNDRLGDLVTGEQAFALVEAVNSLDIGVLQDRYSNMNLLQLCADFDIDLKTAFEFAMKEGWSLPFGVRTNLRVEQEEELLRLYSTVWRKVD